MTAQSSVRSSSAGYQSSSAPSQKYPGYSVASPSQAPVSARIRPQSHPVRPSEQATGRGGVTREAPGRASASDSSRSSSSLGVGVHTAATVDRAPKPCLHKRANHQHGTYTCYTLDSCRCLPCAHAASIYNQQLTRRNAYGRSNLVDAGPAREHVTKLTAAGVGLKTIAARSGVAHGALWKLMYGKKLPDGIQAPSRRITKATAVRLLALDPRDLALAADRARVPSTGATRRLQALACIGWSIRRVADESSIDRQALDQAMTGGHVTAATARGVAAAYDRLWNRPPLAATRFERAGITRTVNAAKASGWAPPLAWDDDTIDDPAARPNRGTALIKQGAVFDEVAVQRAMHGDPVHLRPVERAEVVHRLTEAGYSAAEIAPRVGIDKRSVQRIRDQRRAQEVRRDTGTDSSRESLLGILVSSPDSWYEDGRGRAGGPTLEVS